MDEEGKHIVQDLTPSICYWSDYSRVYYHPRGLHRVPDPVDWEREVGWAKGVERFAAYDAVSSLRPCECKRSGTLTVDACTGQCSA